MNNVFIRVAWKLKKIFFENKAEYNGIHFVGIGEANYFLTTRAADCYGYINGVPVCTFETMDVNGDFLHIEHFALRSNLIGRNLGEKCLRAFADLVRTQQPSIKCISFSLYRSTSKTKECESRLLKLANARKNLLEKIGAVDISFKKPNQECYDVTGKWYKSQWQQ